MRLYFSKMVRIFKAAVLCCAVISLILLGVFQPDQQTVRQSFDIQTSAIVSLGFSSALCMVINDSKKDKIHY